jgi:hypothetical protein
MIELVERAMARDAAARYPSAYELGLALQPFAQGVRMDSLRPPELSEQRPSTRASATPLATASRQLGAAATAQPGVRRWAVAAGVVFVIALGVGALAMSRHPEQTEASSAAAQPEPEPSNIVVPAQESAPAARPEEDLPAPHTELGRAQRVAEAPAAHGGGDAAAKGGERGAVTTGERGARASSERAAETHGARAPGEPHSRVELVTPATLTKPPADKSKPSAHEAAKTPAMPTLDLDPNAAPGNTVRAVPVKPAGHTPRTTPLSVDDF